MRRLLLLAFLSGVLVACDAGPTEDPPTTPADGGETTTTLAPGATSPTTGGGADPAPDQTPLDTRMSWLADLLTSGELADSEYRAIFTADFIDAVPYQEFTAVVNQLAAAGDTWAVERYESREASAAVAVLASTGGESLRANMTIESTPPYRISGLLIQPAEVPTLDDPPADLEEASARLSELGNLELAVMEAESGECRPVFEAGEGTPMPVGSAIKLYVLGAVADAVASGSLSWDEDVAITEEHRSIPTGVLQDEAEGTTFSVREMAETMIAFSDNTATDHLIGLVGRDSVEQALSDYGMEQPDLNIPFLDTMDLSALKIGPASGLATQWVEADEEGRRQILDQISQLHPSDLPLSEFDHPIRPDVIEWFATPADICRVLVELVEHGEPVTQILSINPGLPDEEVGFEYIAFKGGSEPGLLSMSWLVERDDGRRFVISGSVVDPEEDFDQLQATLLFGAVRDLAADL